MLVKSLTILIKKEEKRRRKRRDKRNEFIELNL